MNSVHDLGGCHGFGDVRPEPEATEPIFHEDWEGRVLAMMLAAGMLGRWNIDQSRHARERLDPITYLSNSYYENWLDGLVMLLAETATVTASEFKSGRAETRVSGVAKTAAEAAALIEAGGPATLACETPPVFATGDRVRVVNNHPTGHTRAPRYVRARTGTVDRVHGAHVFADANAHGTRVGRPLYSVRFEAVELWGQQATARSAVYADLWEPHLEAAG